MICDESHRLNKKKRGMKQKKEPTHTHQSERKRESACQVFGSIKRKKDSSIWEVSDDGETDTEREYKLISGRKAQAYCVNNKRYTILGLELSFCFESCVRPKAIK
jgi:hypothetical protein